MKLDIQSQVKSVINLVLTIIIGVFIALLTKSLFYCIGIIIAGILQIIVLFIKSREEKYYDKCMKHREDMEDLDRKLEEKSKKVNYSKKMQTLNERAGKYKKNLSKGDINSFVEFRSKLLNHVRHRK